MLAVAEAHVHAVAADEELDSVGAFEMNFRYGLPLCEARALVVLEEGHRTKENRSAVVEVAIEALRRDAGDDRQIDWVVDSQALASLPLSKKAKSRLMPADTWSVK